MYAARTQARYCAAHEAIMLAHSGKLCRQGHLSGLRVSAIAVRPLQRYPGGHRGARVRRVTAEKSEVVSGTPESSQEEGNRKLESLASDFQAASLDKQETVIGVEGVPQKIIEAERAANPLRRWRLAVYAFASSLAAAQATSCLVEPPTEGTSVGARLVVDALVAFVGVVLWRIELQNRVTNLKLIWKEAEFRATSLKRAEAGLGDTIWTARTRRLTPKSITPTSKFPDDEKDEAL